MPPLGSLVRRMASERERGGEKNRSPDRRFTGSCEIGSLLSSSFLPSNPFVLQKSRPRQKHFCKPLPTRGWFSVSPPFLEKRSTFPTTQWAVQVCAAAAQWQVALNLYDEMCGAASTGGNEVQPNALTTLGNSPQQLKVSRGSSQPLQPYMNDQQPIWVAQFGLFVAPHSGRCLLLYSSWSNAEIMIEAEHRA